MALPLYYKIKSLFTDLTVDLYNAAQNGRVDDVQTIVKFIDKSILSKPYYAFGFFKDNSQMRNRTILMDVAERGYTNITRILLEAGAAPNLIDENGMTAIALASLRADEKTITVLLEGGANPDMADEYRRTPLMHALTNRNFDVSSALVKATKFIDAVDHQKRNALMYAVACGSVAKDLIKDIIDTGANLNWPDSIGDTSLIMAARNNEFEIMNILIAAGADQEIRNEFKKEARDYIQQNADVSLAEKRAIARSLAGSDFVKANIAVEILGTNEAPLMQEADIESPKPA